MKRCWFHKWKKINGTMHGTFEDEPITCEYDEYRICQKCGLVQQFEYDSQGGSWGYLTRPETRIFMAKMKDRL